MLDSLLLFPLGLKWAHNVVCFPADRFQMLIAGSWCEGAAGGRRGHSFSLGEKLFTDTGKSAQEQNCDKRMKYTENAEENSSVQRNTVMF